MTDIQTAKWRSVTASAPAKVILHGEHSVVYGKLALAASIDLRTKVVIKLSSCKKRLLRVSLLNYSKKSLDFDLQILRSLSYNLKTLTEIDNDLCESLARIVCDTCPEEHLSHSEGLVALLYLCVAFFKDSDLDLVPMDIVVSSDIPIGAGLGSSAAFSVALAGALFHLQNGLKRRSDDEEADRLVICKWAFKSEKIIHGNPSGLDNSICTYGGIMSYSTGQALQPLNNATSGNGSLRVLLINSCVPRNTKALIAHVKENRVNLMPKVTASILEAMDRVARDAAETVGKLLNNNNNSYSTRHGHEQGYFHKLEELIDTNQGLLASLGVSHPSLERIISITSRQKIHAKLTGAGGGGFAYALITPWHSNAQINQVKMDLESEGFICWETKLAGDGVKYSRS